MSGHVPRTTSAVSRCDCLIPACSVNTSMTGWLTGGLGFNGTLNTIQVILHNWCTVSPTTVTTENKRDQLAACMYTYTVIQKCSHKLALLGALLVQCCDIILEDTLIKLNKDSLSGCQWLWQTLDSRVHHCWFQYQWHTGQFCSHGNDTFSQLTNYHDAGMNTFLALTIISKGTHK